ncbi:unnamed protein product, partial [Musa acuminata subsp. malaccensis]
MEHHLEYDLKEFNPIDCKLGQAVAIATGAMWWNDLAPSKNLNFARDRSVECYFWILGVFFELYYSRARVIMTKVIALISILDDIYDVYSILEKSQQLAKMQVGRKAYFEESKWSAQHCVPTLEKYLPISLVSSTYPILECASFVGMGEIATEAFEWITSFPKIVQVAAII